MTRLTIPVVAAIAVTLAGCGVLDTVFGVGPNGDPQPGVQNPGGAGSPAGTVGTVVGTWFPWVTGAISTLGAFYAMLRKRQYLKALTAVARGVKVAVDEHAQDGKIEISKLMAALADEQGSKFTSTRELVRSVVARLDRE